jgi:CrcB protein
MTGMFWLAIAVGSALGGMARFAMSHATYEWLGRDFAWGTLGVNVTGSFLVGFLTLMLLDKWAVSAEWKAFLIVGFLGSFTTFATFSYETLQFIQLGDWLKAMLNIAASVLFSILAVLLGFWVAKQFLVL